MDMAEINSLRQQILAAQRGEGEYPSREKLQEALAAIRQERRAPAEKTAKVRAAAAALPDNLSDLF